MRLLITGGTGFFGRALLKQLALRQPGTANCPYSSVTVVTRRPEAFRERHPTLAQLPWVSLYAGDVTDFNSLKSTAAGIPYDALLHAATDSTDSAELTPLRRLDQIVNGTRNMLDFAVMHNIPRFLLTSSGGVYGPQPVDVSEIPETYCGMPDPLIASSTYGIAKRQAEHLCTLYSQTYGLEIVIARCFAFVGDDLPLNAHFAIGNFIRDALYRKQIDVQGNGSPMRSYMHQTDLANWLLTLLRAGRSGQAYNVGSDQAISIADLARCVRDLVSPEKAVHIHGEAFIDNAQRSRYIPSIAKAQTELGLQLTVDLREAIRLTAKNCGHDSSLD